MYSAAPRDFLPERFPRRPSAMPFPHMISFSDPRSFSNSAVSSEAASASSRCAVRCRRIGRGAVRHPEGPAAAAVAGREVGVFGAACCSKNAKAGREAGFRSVCGTRAVVPPVGEVRFAREDSPGLPLLSHPRNVMDGPTQMTGRDLGFTTQLRQHDRALTRPIGESKSFQHSPCPPMKLVCIRNYGRACSSQPT